MPDEFDYEPEPLFANDLIDGDFDDFDVHPYHTADRDYGGYDE